MNKRAKGLRIIKKVKSILEELGHVVDGPFYKSRFFGGKVMSVHCDIFNCFDLISFYDGYWYLHQVSTVVDRAKKIRLLQEKGFPGWVWLDPGGTSRNLHLIMVDLRGRTIDCEVFQYTTGDETTWVIREKLKVMSPVLKNSSSLQTR